MMLLLMVLQGEMRGTRLWQMRWRSGRGLIAPGSTRTRP